MATGARSKAQRLVCCSLVVVAHSVAVQKLAYSVPTRDDREAGAWNQRPRDAANAVDYIGKGVERELHWQILPEDRPIEEWLAAPTLLITGSGPFDPSDEARERLRDFAHRGGLIVVNPDCGDRRFRDAAVKQFEDLFGSEFESISDEHSIWRQQFTMADVRRKPKLLGLSNGVREFVVIADGGDLGRDWHLNPRGPDNRTQAAFDIGANLILYAAGGSAGLEPKGTLVATKNDTPADRTVVVGRLQHGGKWNPRTRGVVERGNHAS